MVKSNNDALLVHFRCAVDALMMRREDRCAKCVYEDHLHKFTFNEADEPHY